MPESSKTRSNKPFGIVQALGRNVLKTSNKQAETIRARRVASTVATFMLKILAPREH
jgi:hypothetical protein